MEEKKIQKYYRGKKIQYKGCLFHSLLELKFILLIENKCSWIREPFAIHYNPDTLKVTNYITEKTKRYVPDFLVRKWSDNSGHLIEIKPKAFIDSEEMQVRNSIMADYLASKKVDLKFKVITEDDIVLNEEQYALFQEVVNKNKHLGCKLATIKTDKKYNNYPQKYFLKSPYQNSDGISDDDYITYVRYGILPDSKGECDIILGSNTSSDTISEKKKHKIYLNTEFHINCSKEIFNIREIELLEKYGSWLEALYSHKINPITKEQGYFVEQIDKGVFTDNDIVKVWYKYLKRLEIEKKYGDKLKMNYRMDCNDFYKREDYYKLHKDKKPRI